MIRTETDLQECRRLWSIFSPQQDAWDDWDLMYAFHDQDKHRLNFLVHQSDDETPNGLIPLVYDTGLNRYMLMGGSYPDGRILWLRYEDFPEFFGQFPERTVLFDLKQSWVSGLLQLHPEFDSYFAEPDLRYYLAPPDFGFDFDKHLDTLPADKKPKFLYDLRNIRKREPTLQWSEKDEAELFIDLVNRNFGAESDYANPEDALEVRRVVHELESSGRLRTMTIEIDGVRQAVSLSLLHNNKMVALYASSNNDYNNLGKLLNVETINEACRLRVDEISFMVGMQWKANWKMTSEPCNTFRKPVAPWSAE
ncbi:GNAT family N-acetyltransferase [Woeseia oceani]|uniref:GNAT family N-acetyltransferase n=1 Tax=Woeseia oceani TaxID=1548547 RepID=UPI0012EAC4AA|nr:GNAT family N-acetyltransferase [Woeseia oceani]